ncbi:sensor histidine kinase [Trichothermofontia sp.]
MPQWFLPTLSDLVAGGEWAMTGTMSTGSLYPPTFAGNSPPPAAIAASPDVMPSAYQLREAHLRSEREWHAAIAAISQLLTTAPASSGTPKGLIIFGPLPLLADPTLAQHYQTWLLTTEAYQQHHQRTLLPAAEDRKGLPMTGKPVAPPNDPQLLPLLVDDPQAQEPFCLVLTPHFSLVMVLRRISHPLREPEAGHAPANLPLPAFLFSFDPAVVTEAWQSLHDRLCLSAPDHLPPLVASIQQFAPVAPDYRTVTQFTRLLLHHLPQPQTVHSHGLRSHPNPKSNVRRQRAKFHTPLMAAASTALPRLESKTNADITLLQALAHEVRTPLATIRTFVRSLLRRRDLAAEVRQRLETIDHECTEQIDRFGLIFQAVEMETRPVEAAPMCLAPTSLGDVFQECVPRWQKQANRRNLKLQVYLPEAMPTVVSNPALLDQALTSLVDRFTRSLPAGSHIQVQVTLAGAQLKLQLQSCGSQGRCLGQPTQAGASSAARSIGQILMFQPDTGSLSLNLSVAKNLFQALGGRLIVRQRPEQGEVLTVFLPLDEHEPESGREGIDQPRAAADYAGKTWVV